jgi:2-polyprenyl-6-methoxyphenol hydroxylase-like FAD-dependent oxidoreductase
MEDEHALSSEEIQRHLQGVARVDDDYPVIDAQLYRVHQRVAGTFRKDRIMLVGDAAHLNSPVGGVGLNSGIHDAFDLTRRLARILAGTGDMEDELESFSNVRRQVAVEYVQADTVRNTNRMREKDPALREESARELRTIASTPESARQWLRRVSLLESVRRFGIGLSPAETRARLASALDDIPSAG